MPRSRSASPGSRRSAPRSSVSSPAALPPTSPPASPASSARPRRRRRSECGMRALKRELLFFALIGVLFFIATGFSAFNTEKNYSGENPDQVEPGRLTLDDRIGFAIILNAGYGTVQLIPASSDNGYTPHFQVSDQFKPELACISNKVGDATRDAPEGSGLGSLENPHALVESILAAEQYNRGSLQRILESALAHVALALTGHVPEMSLGLG